jgi:molybdopterin-containing oxidoreductase family iron-sulfur binding subunit
MSGATDIAELRRRLQAGGRRYWSGLDDIAVDAELDRLLGDEFPSFRQAAIGGDRRDFLRIMAASLLLAGAAGCSPERSEDALPYVVQPEDVVPGRPSYYATAVVFEGYAQPVLAVMQRGRPTKLEGNPEHPAVSGRSDLFTQAAILDLYDPDRSAAPLLNGEPATYAAFDRLLFGLRAKWAANAGEGLALLVEPSTSPTLLRQLGQLAALYPKAGIHVVEAVEAGPRGAATELAFGRVLDVHLRLGEAQTIVSLDDDFLGPGPRQVPHVRDWATRRGEAVGPERRVRLLMAECTPSQTGTVADRRLAVAPSRIPALVAGIAAQLGLGQAGAADTLAGGEKSFVVAAAAELKREAGRSLLTVGAACAPDAQALAFAVNEALGNAGSTIVYAEPIRLAPVAPLRTLEALVEELNAGRVDTLVTIGTNPVYAAPADLDVAGAMKRARLRIHAGLFQDETAQECEWHIPLPHALESWSDARAVDGTATILQPLIAPLHASRSVHELLAGLIGHQGEDARALVEATWRERFGPGFDVRWRRALHDGFVADTASRMVGVAARYTETLRLPAIPESGTERLEVLFRPDPTIWDGRFANNAWLQELGKPLTKISWENVVGVSPALAEARGLSDGDLVRIDSRGRAIEGPVLIMPGQPAGVVTLSLGYGRFRAGRVGDNIGYDANRLRRADTLWYATDGVLTPSGKRAKLASMQPHQRIEGDDFVRLVSATDLDASRPDDAEQDSLYPAWKQQETGSDQAASPNAWGMVIDLDLCSGCNACVIACQAENNIPVVGKDMVAQGRMMHWLRVDRYYSGSLDEPDSVFQPVPCMHCEKAPCEMGCPVHATVHGPDGLNQMVYNRCIGTRTCSSYCPYKVRRFNWFDLTSDTPEIVAAQRNPDVTVRGRGVMEKCTYCVQRIRAAQTEADIGNRAIGHGEVETACQQACPSRAITFGNIADPASDVAEKRGSKRNYGLLAHLGTRPRTTYLARIEADPALAADDGAETP